MTPNRFLRLLEAYGADIERWPPAERARARLLAAQESPALRQAIEGARMLDDLLGEYRLASPSPELAARVAERAMASPSQQPAARVAERAMALPPQEPAARAAKTAMASPVRRRGTAGWVGIGLAGIGLAGMLAGAVAFSAMFNLTASESSHDGLSDNSDVFGVNIAEWSD